MAVVGNKCKLGIDTKISNTVPIGHCKNTNLLSCCECGFNKDNICDRVKLLKEKLGGLTNV